MSHCMRNHAEEETNEEVWIPVKFESTSLHQILFVYRNLEVIIFCTVKSGLWS